MSEKDKKTRKTIWANIYEIFLKYLKGVSTVLGFIVLLTGISVSSWFVCSRPVVMGSWVTANVDNARTNKVADFSGPATDLIVCHSISQIPEGYKISETPPVAVCGRLYFIIGEDQPVGIRNGILVCIDVDSGKLEWKFKPKTNDGLMSNAQMTYSERELFIGNGTTIYVIDYISGVLLRQHIVTDEDNPLFSKIIKPIVFVNTVDRWERESRKKNYSVLTGHPDYIVSRNKLKAYLESNQSDIYLFRSGLVHKKNPYPEYKLKSTDSYFVKISETIAECENSEEFTNAWEPYKQAHDIKYFAEIKNESLRVPQDELTKMIPGLKKELQTLKREKDIKKLEDDIKEMEKNLSSLISIRKWLVFLSDLSSRIMNDRVDVASNAKYMLDKIIYDYNHDKYVTQGSQVHWNSFIEEHCNTMSTSVLLQDAIDFACNIKSMICENENLYIMTSGGYLFCLDLETLTTKWLSLAGTKYFSSSDISIQNGTLTFVCLDSDTTTSKPIEEASSPVVVEYSTSNKTVSVKRCPRQDNSIRQVSGLSSFHMGSKYSTFIKDNRLFLLKNKKFNGSIDFKYSTSDKENMDYVRPIMDENFAYVCNKEGLYGINLDKIDYDSYTWDINNPEKKPPFGWIYRWDNTHSTHPPVTKLYNNRILVLENNILRCFTSKPIIKKGVKTKGECLWAISKDNLNEQSLENLRDEITFTENMIIFNSHIYIFGEKQIVSLGDKRGFSGDAPPVYEIKP